jgi:outer membrane protein assembly factor BamA
LTLFARYLRLSVDPYPASLLAEERPPGVEGGQELSFGPGLLLDRRDNEIAPSRGYLLEAALRGATRGFASSHTYAGATVRALAFVPVGSRIVVGARLEADLLTAGAPLFELSRFGGVDPIEGVGGERSVRGIPKARFIGRAKALASGELRLRMFEARILDRPVSFAVAAFYDAGRVWQLRGEDGRFLDLHSGAGGGLRIQRGKTVVRVDAGTSAQRAFNLYFTLGNAF